MACFSAQSVASRASVSASSKVGRRVIAGVVALVCSGVLGLAAWLTPSPTGLGTHQALKFPPCGWITMADLPCPTCGMTTAFAHAANGNLVASFLAQPMGCILALATAITLLVSVQVLITGSNLGRSFTVLWGKATVWGLSAIVFFSWMYKILTYKGWL
ncbi:MAG: DUF2752 domain-containing protein [Phycisphaerales bacterium]|nr:DUF2752 domain-containing protein [Phycisphaerales bacterium]